MKNGKRVLMYLYVNQLLKYLLVKTDVDVNILSSIAQFQKYINDLILANRFIEIEQKLNLMFAIKIKSLNSQHKNLFEIHIDDVKSLQIVFDKWSKEEIIYGNVIYNTDEFAFRKISLIEMLDTVLLEKSIKSI